MFFLIFFFPLQPSQVECVESIFVDNMAMSKSHIAIHNSCYELYIFDLSLNLVKKFSVSEYSRIFTLKEYIAVFDSDSKSDSFLIDEKPNKIPIGSFAPRWISNDGNTLVFFPSFNINPQPKNGQRNYRRIENTKNLQRFDYVDGEITLIGERFFKITPSQYRNNLEWKGFWAFENKKNGLDIITQKDPFVFNEIDSDLKKLEIPEFSYKIDLVEMTDKIFTYPEYRFYLLDIYIESSIILGVYRFNCGFVICYADHGAVNVTFSRLAFYDENWQRYGNVQIIPGKLIGIQNEKGYMLTYPDEAMVSELSIIELIP